MLSVSRRPVERHSLAGGARQLVNRFRFFQFQPSVSSRSEAGCGFEGGVKQLVSRFRFFQFQPSFPCHSEAGWSGLRSGQRNRRYMYLSTLYHCCRPGQGEMFGPLDARGCFGHYGGVGPALDRRRGNCAAVRREPGRSFGVRRFIAAFRRMVQASTKRCDSGRKRR
jgi:hypothetical protein